jgi:hypothetical protein
MVNCGWLVHDDLPLADQCASWTVDDKLLIDKASERLRPRPDWVRIGALNQSKE